jgi:hypothetical protein
MLYKGVLSERRLRALHYACNALLAYVDYCTAARRCVLRVLAVPSTAALLVYRIHACIDAMQYRAYTTV